MANYSCYLLNAKGNQVFYDKKPDLTKGDLYISVSQVLSMEGSGDFLIKWALREFGGRAFPIKAYDTFMTTVSDLGSRLHKWVEYDLKGLVYPEEEALESMLPGIEAWDLFKSQHEIELIDSEKILHSKSLKVAGTMDLRIKIDGQVYIADLKTGSVQDKAFYQLAIYRHMLKEMGLANPGEKLLVLGGADSKSKIAQGGAVIMHTLDSWFDSEVTEEDMFVHFMCLRHLWYMKNLKSKKFYPVIKGMNEFVAPIVERFKTSFINLEKESKTK